MRVALVGNGASDLCAARVADLVLARDTLAALCRAEGIPHVAWRDLAEVRAALGTAVAGDLGAALDCPSPPPRGAA
jgi:2-hydroxy-3-keto-5-methylthiopentenyl-1-phosphate phosphatase